MLLYAVTIFLSAFLLFQVQPLIAKFILPWFGGSAAVWSAALLFFQLLLLAGYLYAHVIIKYLKPKQQLMVHGPLLILAALTLPIIPSDSWKPEVGAEPTFQILALLAATIGLPYMILSSTSPLLQAWFVRTNEGVIPYRLFALSNFGSFLALLSYPFLIEPNIALSNQAYIWSGGFILFAIACAIAGMKSTKTLPTPQTVESGAPAADPPAAEANESMAAELVAAETVDAELKDDGPPTWTSILYWIGLSACASTLLLATTSHLTQNVAPIPLLWVVPLSIYLLSFILSFESDRIYQQWIFLPLGLISLAAFARGMQDYENNEDVIRSLIPMLCVALFIACMVCHGELARRKPHPNHLTQFFLMVSVGGAMGGIFVALIAPYIFPSYWEMPIAVGAMALLMVVAVWSDAKSAERPLVLGVAAAVGAAIGYAYLADLLGWSFQINLLGAWSFDGGPWVIAAIGAAVFFALGWFAQRFLSASILVRGSLVLLALFFCLYLSSIQSFLDSGYLFSQRNFYGVMRVSQYSDGYYEERALIHGTINHGTELLIDDGGRIPTSYFGDNSGINRAIRTKGQNGPIRLGIIGLGAGVTATLAREGDTLHYYEIDPDVFEIAQKDFDFWKACPADKEIYFGDGRLTLERMPDENLDVLVMDAFSSDAVPAHLLTEEAFQIYLKHLNPGGLIIVNVTNRYLDLEPVVAAAAEKIGFSGRYVYDDGAGQTYYEPNSWIIITKDDAFFNSTNFTLPYVYDLEPREGFEGWTDDYSNIFEILQE